MSPDEALAWFTELAERKLPTDTTHHQVLKYDEFGGSYPETVAVRSAAGPSTTLRLDDVWAICSQRPPLSPASARPSLPRHPRVSEGTRPARLDRYGRVE